MKIAILGVGGLGAALAQGLMGKHTLVLCDRHADKLARFATAQKASTPKDAVDGADVVLLCVKPAATVALAREIAPFVAPHAVLVSCAAGIPLQALSFPGCFLGGIARAMPNVGAAMQASTTAVVLGASGDVTTLRARVSEVFAAAGTVVEVTDEDLLHVITAVSGSGPAWILYVVESLIAAGIKAGLGRADAAAFAGGALRAASARLQAGESAEAIVAQITSPRGTTAAGVAALVAGGVAETMGVAVAAAVTRSRELSTEAAVSSVFP